VKELPRHRATSTPAAPPSGWGVAPRGGAAAPPASHDERGRSALRFTERYAFASSYAVAASPATALVSCSPFSAPSSALRRRLLSPPSSALLPPRAVAPDAAATRARLFRRRIGRSTALVVVLGLRVEYAKVEGLLFQNDLSLLDLNPPNARSNGQEKLATWPRSPFRILAKFRM
jgi:hypothetical protein